jgi:hypothetical protein
MLDDFAVFILTHGRPNKVITYDTLRRQGYTGPVYIIIDNEDKTAAEYRRNFDDKVIVFDKAAIAKTFDEGDNFNDRRAVIYARNASFQIARDLGLKWFLQLDDDYTKFEYRINSKGEYPRNYWIVQSELDRIFDAFLGYYLSTQAQSIAMAQGGDFIGGASEFGQPKRKCMNTFFCSTDRPFQFVGRVNEDVNTYTWFQSLGHLFLTIPFVSVTQVQTQDNAGGMTEMYLDSGTFIKSFYTVMYAPSCTHIAMMGQHHRRLHHSIDWPNAVPCIVPETLRKAVTTA